MPRDLTLSYKNHRRKRLRPLPPAPLQANQVVDSDPPEAPGLEREIHFLRQAIADLASARSQARSLDDRLRIIQTLSLVADRLAGLLLAHKKLTAKDENDIETWLTSIANEVLHEKGWDA